MKKHIAVLVTTFALMLPAAAWAQQGGGAADADMAALRTAVRADRKALVVSTLDLTPTEAKKFWPAYDAYQRSLDAANRRRVVVIEALIGTDKPLTDLQARNLARELIAADEAEFKARRTLNNRVLKVLPEKKAARYLQLEGKIRAMQAYDAAEAIPLIR